jgi:hypothetical protein
MHCSRFLSLALLVVAIASLSAMYESAGSGEGLKPVRPEDPASPVHPRKFGFPGGVGPTRGWYVWHKFDADQWTAEVSHEATGEKYRVRVLPWATTYRHLAYGAHPDELHPGERVNLFFAPEGKVQRAYLVHFQDELCQMKGHGHVWEIQSVNADGKQFAARVIVGEKSLDNSKPAAFRLGTEARHWRGGKQTDAVALQKGERLYMTWVYRDGGRVVLLTADDTSLDAVKKREQEVVTARLATDGLGAHVEAVEDDVVRLLIFPTYWSQSGQWKDGQEFLIRATTASLRPAGTGIPAKLLTRKNLGTYGSGATEISVRLTRPDDAAQVRQWLGAKVVRVVSK